MNYKSCLYYIKVSSYWKQEIPWQAMSKYSKILYEKQKYLGRVFEFLL